MDLDTTLLRAFVTVVRSGSINRAAALLGRTQPALSLQVRKLEERLGQTILQRSPRGITLTKAGEALLPYAERIVALTDQVIPGVNGHDLEPEQQRRIGLMEDFVGSRLPRVLADFAAVHPRLKLDVQVASGAQMTEAFRLGQLDVLIADPAAASGLSTPPLWVVNCPLVWVGKDAHWSGMSPLPLVMFFAPCSWRDATLAALNQAQIPWRIAFESTSLQAVLAAVEAGLGVAALLPDALPCGVRQLPNDALPMVPPTRVGMFCRPGNQNDDVTKQLCQLFYREISVLAVV
jgi:DNA-binding transcriptional LysR family regulator